MNTLDLFNKNAQYKFPQTRYQGSKLKYVDWIYSCLSKYSFNTVLDAFGGTGVVSFKFKQEEKQVAYNDILKFNSIIGTALIENSNTSLNRADVDFILKKHDHIKYNTFIYDKFKDVYYTDTENQWLDIIVQNIVSINNKYKRAVAFFALFQSCIIKRPYNLFHRKNLYVRLQDVERGFGNKVSWDRPFEVYFRRFVEECNSAIFDNHQINEVYNSDVETLPENYDLVYLDPPYVNINGVGINYLKFYHFLEGLVNYEKWETLIDERTKHLQLLVSEKSDWESEMFIHNSFERVIRKFSKSIIAISYRFDGLPSISNLKEILERNGKKVVIYESQRIKYALSKNSTSEILVVGL